ncbi:hypothetical protein LJ739_06840 [Aestuariibacter halophilus]|uniref:Uncharacterized protein n=2 Tax=Fluctibacter halophilus TaxID=226011 RepID=A0ABS8G627_9ALTE|nr:hypothetical protein [Aestuariibacter halophilus]
MIIAQWEHHKWLQVTVNNEKQRSDLQNNSLHLWCQMVADAANENGFDVKSFVNEVTSRAEIPWTGSVVKELIWRPTQIAYTAEQSTTKASTKDYVVICDIINKAMGESMGIHVPWPCKRNKDVA